jgi:hypothetical protein
VLLQKKWELKNSNSSKRYWIRKRISIKIIANQGFEISSIKDVTPVPHNGCRPKKPEGYNF